MTSHLTLSDIESQSQGQSNCEALYLTKGAGLGHMLHCTIKH